MNTTAKAGEKNRPLKDPAPGIRGADEGAGPLDAFSASRAGGVLAAALLAAAIVVSTATHFAATVLPSDDAFITFRYVENLLDGKGFVYNEGQRVLGVSTLAWPFALSGLKLIFAGVPLPELAVRANAFFWAAAGIGFFLFLRRVTGNRLVAAVAASALLVTSGLLIVSLSAMESSLFAALLFFALWALAAGRPVALGVLSAFLALTRPEAVVLLPVALLAWWGQWRRLATAAAAFLPLPVVAGIVAFLYYGSPVPLSIVAKAKLYPLAFGYSVATILTWLERYFTGGRIESFRQAGTLLVVGAIALASLATVLHAPSRRSLAWTAAIVFCSLLALYLVGNPLFFEWYWPPFLATALAAVVAGAVAAGRFLETRLSVPGALPSRRRLALLVPAAALAWLVAITASEYLGPPMTSAAQRAREEPVYLRVEGYEVAARHLAPALAPRDRVLCAEVGTLGYYLPGRYMIDACGLVSPEAIPFLPVPPEERFGPDSGAIPVELVRRTTPEWIVTMPMFASKSLLVSRWFGENYSPWGKVKLPVSCWGSEHILIFRRNAAR